jgi:DNA invertase Pin-like site-specific DNA recombinase
MHLFEGLCKKPHYGRDRPDGTGTQSRTHCGRAAAKARGRTGGRPRTDPDKLEHARILYLNSRKSAADVCHMVGIGRRTLFSYLAQVRQQEQTKAAP